MKKTKYPNVLLSHYELIKSVPIEFREVLSYSLLCYIFDGVKKDLPGETLETWEILEKKINLARQQQITGKRGGYSKHKNTLVEPYSIKSAFSIENSDTSSISESPVNTEKLTASPARANKNININNNRSILTTAATSSQEKNAKVINKAKETVFIPPTIEELSKFFTENGYTEEAAKLCWNYYQDGDWIDSQGRPVQNWKRKIRFNWFKPEYLAAKGSVYTRKEYRPA